MDETTAQEGGLGEKQLAAANAENEDAFAGSGDPSGGASDDAEFSNDHPLASPTELAGTTEHAIEAEFAARDAIDAQSDAAGAASGIDYEEDTLPLDGE
jgi:hypothetical protein